MMTCYYLLTFNGECAWALIGPDRSRDPNTGLWLVDCYCLLTCNGECAWARWGARCASPWRRRPGHTPGTQSALIGPDRSRDPNSGFWLVDSWIPASYRSGPAEEALHPPPHSACSLSVCLFFYFCSVISYWELPATELKLSLCNIFINFWDSKFLGLLVPKVSFLLDSFTGDWGSPIIISTLETRETGKAELLRCVQKFCLHQSIVKLTDSKAKKIGV